MTDSSRQPIPKLLGADIELGNSIVGLELEGGTGPEASRALLRQINGHRDRRTCALPVINEGTNRGYGWSRSWGSANYSYNAQDWGRKYLSSNGGCAYIDLNHLELCVPEVLSAHDHVACWHAMLRIARSAQVGAGDALPDGQSVRVMVNNSDGLSNSYGSHLNVLMTRHAWNNLFRRKLHHTLFLAAYQASSIIFTGQGKVGSENGAQPVPFQISQRADFFETLTGTQTTHNRPLINSRNEPLCGSRQRGNQEDLARLHVIFYDNTLCHVASFLKLGVLQIILAMIEAEDVDPTLALDDPVEAVVAWSHDPHLEARVRLTSGLRLSALEVQLEFLDRAQRFVASGGCEGIVPEAETILSLWQETLMLLQQHDLVAVARRVDWALKFMLLEGVISEHAKLDWNSPEIKHLDQLYGSLDPDEGLYWAYEKSGFVENVVSDSRIEHFVSHPPEDTRAWGRAMLLRLAENEIDEVNWDYLTFRKAKKRARMRLDMANPLDFGRTQIEPVLAGDPQLGDVLESLGASEVTYHWKSTKAEAPAQKTSTDNRLPPSTN
ncbi:MAG: proteasome accessory factor PafA2 family protein [bacterium]|nr:proteasome accessory factor PafA2 family protein [bacterium]